MWLWDWEFRQHGLRRLSPRYWRCERRYGLPRGAHLSVFSEAEVRRSRAGDVERERVDICAFHVTFRLGTDHIHFYYHEVADGVWGPGGHTSTAEIRRYPREPAELRAVADRVATEFLSALGVELRPRTVS